MKLSYALLADLAHVENGKVYIIGGGVTILWRPAYPAAVAATVVVSFSYNNIEAGSERVLKLQINDADGQVVAPPFEWPFVLAPRVEGVPATVPLESILTIAIAPNIPLLSTPGDYAIELMADNNHVATLPFSALLSPSSE
jgi:hypothetical protein